MNLNDFYLVMVITIFKNIFRYLTQYDCVTFYNLVNSLRTTETAIQSSGWMFLGAAETLFVNAKLRVFGSAASPTKKSVREDNAKKLKREYIGT